MASDAYERETGEHPGGTGIGPGVVSGEERPASSPDTAPAAGKEGVFARLKQNLRQLPGKYAWGPFKQKEKRVADPADEILPGDDLRWDEHPLPPLDPDEEKWVIERYWLVPPFAYAKIVKNWEMDLEYVVVEPRVSEKEFILLEETYEELRNVLIYTSPARKETATFDEGRIREIIRSFDPEIDDERMGILIYFLRRNFAGFGKLDPLMHDINIEDITCNGKDVPVFIYHRNYANLATNIRFEDDELNKYALKIAQKAN
jgi:flagellar protein FlaI